MLTTFHDGDLLLACTRRVPMPPRFDVILLRDPRKTHSIPMLLLKRVVGLPGETIELRDAVLYINGIPKHEPWLDEHCLRFRRDFGPFRCRKTASLYLATIAEPPPTAVPSERFRAVFIVGASAGK